VSAAGSASPRAAAARLAAANVFGKPGPHSEGVLRQFLRGRLPAGTSLAPTTLCRDDAAKAWWRDGLCWLLNFDARASRGNHWAGLIMSHGNAYFVCSFGTRGPPKAITAAIQACLPPGGKLYASTPQRQRMNLSDCGARTCTALGLLADAHSSGRVGQVFAAVVAAD
jgi:hypothetical protein